MEAFFYAQGQGCDCAGRFAILCLQKYFFYNLHP